MDAMTNGFLVDNFLPDRLPVFLQDWWLAAARDAMRRPYRENRIFRDGAVAGYLGYTLKKKRAGLRCWEPFDWCRVNEPVLSQALSATEKASVLRELMAALPRHISFEFVCGPTAGDLALITEAATEAGFKHRRETIFWQPPEHSQAVMQRVNKKYRQGLKQAALALDLVALSPEEFIRLYNANLIAAKRRPYSDPNVAKSLIEAGLNRPHPQTRILAAKKKSPQSDEQTIDAAIACAWDSERYYYWMTTCTRFGDLPEKAHTHAVKYLLLNAVQDAGARGLIFDTDGGDHEGAAKQFRDLKFEYTAERLVFTRHSVPMRLYNASRPYFKRALTRVTSAAPPQ